MYGHWTKAAAPVFALSPPFFAKKWQEEVVRMAHIFGRMGGLMMSGPGGERKKNTLTCTVHTQQEEKGKREGR